MPTTVIYRHEMPKTLRPGLPPMPVWRFTVDQYHRLIQAGILTENNRCELIHGWILPKMPTNPTHASPVRILDKRLQKLVGDRAVVGVQQPITTPDSEPEPDLTISRGPESCYYTTHPKPEDVYFPIEVADTSLEYDRGEKLALYAAATIAVYWIVNVEEACIEVHREPRSGRRSAYKQCDVYKAGEAVPVVIEGEKIGAIKVNELFS